MRIVPVARAPGSVVALPSQDGLRLILAGMAYLATICAIQLSATVGSLAGLALPANAFDVRDVVALFGWVGFMICGVSVIIVPNHLRVRVRPSYLPKLHFGLGNVGLVGYLTTALFAPSPILSAAFLALVSVSFLLFGLGVLAAVIPFLRLASPRPARRTGQGYSEESAG